MNVGVYAVLFFDRNAQMISQLEVLTTAATTRKLQALSTTTVATSAPLTQEPMVLSLNRNTSSATTVLTSLTSALCVGRRREEEEGIPNNCLIE